MNLILIHPGRSEEWCEIPDLLLQSHRIMTSEEINRVNVSLALYIEINQVPLHATTCIR